METKNSQISGKFPDEILAIILSYLPLKQILYSAVLNKQMNRLLTFNLAIFWAQQFEQHFSYLNISNEMRKPESDYTKFLRAYRAAQPLKIVNHIPTQKKHTRRQKKTKPPKDSLGQKIFNFLKYQFLIAMPSITLGIMLGGIWPEAPRWIFGGLFGIAGISTVLFIIVFILVTKLTSALKDDNKAYDSDDENKVFSPPGILSTETKVFLAFCLIAFLVSVTMIGLSSGYSSGNEACVRFLGSFFEAVYQFIAQGIVAFFPGGTTVSIGPMSQMSQQTIQLISGVGGVFLAIMPFVILVLGATITNFILEKDEEIESILDNSNDINSCPTLHNYSSNYSHPKIFSDPPSFSDLTYSHTSSKRTESVRPQLSH